MTLNPIVSPSPQAWGPTLRDRLDQIMNRGIEQGVFPGGIVLIRHRNAIVVHEAYGHSSTHHDASTRSSAQHKTRPETVYDLASITKVFTATCMMRLVDEQAFHLDDPVAKRLAEFAANGKGEITVRQLLAHVAGLPNLRLWEKAPTTEARFRSVMAVPPGFSAGTAMEYSDTNFIVLGRLIEAVAGESLSRALAARILDPLGLSHTRYGPFPGPKADIAATEDESYVERGMVWGEVHDENAWCVGGTAGHAGLFGTARDLSIFGQMYLNGGTYDGVEVLKPATVAEMTRNQIGALGDRGLGWQVNAPHYMGGLASPRTYGHTGFTGTSIVIDPRRDLVVVLLTNRVHPTRHGPDVNLVRHAVAEAVRDAVDTI